MYMRMMCVHYFITPTFVFQGFATNREWNSLRSKGTKRPVSVFEIQSQVRRKSGTQHVDENDHTNWYITQILLMMVLLSTNRTQSIYM